LSSTYLAELFNSLSDEELIRRAASGELTDAALALAAAELMARGLDVPPVQSDEEQAPAAYQGDLTVVARHLTATEAYLLASCLNAAGVPAETADTNFVQTNSLLIGAVGGASVRVPANFVSEAQNVIAAFRRGDFALSDDFNPDE
jgi:hypothetical protein